MQACDAPHVVNEPDIDISNFNEILEVTLTWLLEAQDKGAIDVVIISLL